MFVESLESRTLLSVDPAAPAAEAPVKITPQITLDLQASQPIPLGGWTGGVHDLVTDHVRHHLLAIGTNAIATFDQDDGEFLGEMKMPVELGDADITPDGKYLYVTQVGGTSILKINLDNGQYTSVNEGWVGVGSTPQKLAVAKDRVIVDEWAPGDAHRLYQINLADDQVSFLLLSLNSNPLGFYGPLFLGRSADFNRVSIISSNNDYYYDATTGIVSGRGDISSEQRVSVSRDGSLHAVDASGSTYIYDAQGQLVTSLQIDNARFIFDPNRDIFYIFGDKYFGTDFKLTAYDTHTWEPIFSRPLQADPNGDFAISDNGAWLYFPVLGAGGVRMISTDGNRSAYGGSITMTAHVESDSVIPSGNVTFINAQTGAIFGSGTLQDGAATFTSNTLHTGSYQILARYSGDEQCDSVQSIQEPFSIVRAVPSFSPGLDGPLGPGFTIAVGETGAAPATGTVQLLEGQKVVASGQLNNGQVHLTPSVPLGKHFIWPRYLGSADFFPVSYPDSQQIQLAQSSTTTLVSATPTAYVGKDLVITAKTIAGQLAATGYTTLYDGNNFLRTVRNSRTGIAVFNIGSLSPGSHRLTAFYNGTELIAPSSSRSITQKVLGVPTTVTISAPSSINFGAVVHLTAKVTTPSGRIVNEGLVTFKANNQLLGGEFVTNGKTSLPTILGAGINKITAVYTGERTYAQSSAKPITVNAIEGLTVLKLSASTSYALRSQPITFSADLNAPGDAATPAGNIVLKEGTRIVGTAALDNGHTVFSPISLKAGVHNITATYAGDSHFHASVSRPVQVTIAAGTTVDLMIVYTPAARGEAGSADDMQSLLDESVNATNQAFLNSHIPLALNLVYTAEVNYVESGRFSTDLHRLTTHDDGYMDSVHTLRNTYHADLVSLFVNDGDLGGLGWELRDMDDPTNDDFAFSVVLASQAAAPYYTLAHELGHNFGATHDADHAKGRGVTSFSNGWRFRGSDGVLYHDIMSYDPGETIPYFANPRIKYKGVPTGNANSADVARTITLTAPYVASYRRRA